MHIKQIHVYQRTLEIVGEPYTMARTLLTELDSTIVELVKPAKNGRKQII